MDDCTCCTDCWLACVCHNQSASIDQHNGLERSELTMNSAHLTPHVSLHSITSRWPCSVVLYGRLFSYQPAPHNPSNNTAKRRKKAGAGWHLKKSSIQYNSRASSDSMATPTLLSPSHLLQQRCHHRFLLLLLLCSPRHPSHPLQHRLQLLLVQPLASPTMQTPPPPGLPAVNLSRISWCTVM
jgi:hypothetical protein